MTRGEASEIQWAIEEFDHEPPSLLFGKDVEAPSAQDLHQLSVLLPKLEFLAEPALFREHVAIYYHTAERGQRLFEAIARFCQESEIDCYAPDR